MCDGLMIKNPFLYLFLRLEFWGSLNNYEMPFVSNWQYEYLYPAVKKRVVTYFCHPWCNSNSHKVQRLPFEEEDAHHTKCLRKKQRVTDGSHTILSLTKN